MSFNPAKVSLMAFAVLFKILSAYCELGLHKVKEHALVVQNIQLRAKVYIRLLNKPYVNEVTLTRQNLLLNCC